MPVNPGETVAASSRRLMKFIRARVRLAEDAEDILQDVFYQFARITNPVENPAAWLYRACRNRIIDHYRKKKDEPFPVFFDEDEEDWVLGEITDIVHGTELSPETEHLRSLIAGEIQSALEDLPPEQREVFELSELEGMKVKKIAEKTGATASAVLSRKHYAVKFLRSRLEELYGDIMGMS